MKKDTPIEELLDTKPGKYFKARKSGKTKRESALVAGYSGDKNVTQIENTQTFQTIQRHFKDVLLEKIEMGDIAEALADNIKQESDRGARNQAIKIALDKIEPELVKDDENDRLVVVIR